MQLTARLRCPLLPSSCIPSIPKVDLEVDSPKRQARPLHRQLPDRNPLLSKEKKSYMEYVDRMGWWVGKLWTTSDDIFGMLSRVCRVLFFSGWSDIHSLSNKPPLVFGTPPNPFSPTLSLIWKDNHNCQMNTIIRHDRIGHGTRYTEGEILVHHVILLCTLCYM